MGLEEPFLKNFINFVLQYSMREDVCNLCWRNTLAVIEHDCSVVVLFSASYKSELRGRLRTTSERSKKLGETSQVVDSMEYTCAACQRNFTNLSVRFQVAPQRYSKYSS